ncbi:MAG: 5-(carboxyamino)imidazole ribonucleotide synthase, partial [Alphaproteobacteria bacterium]|nr:5-(carboxyamino)imidazole ribonucleotide synthase [Alphaproteobacteria bacterium]
ENIPAESAEFLARKVPLRPSVRCLEVAQDRIREKTFLNAHGGPTAPFAPVGSAAELEAALATIGRPAVLKTATLGYDGKGQVKIEAETEAAAAFAAMGADRGILEGFVDFASEISVILARQAKDRVAFFEPVENRHRHHILDTTIAPAPIGPELAHQAMAIGEAIADGLDLVGLLAVEMFVTRDETLLVNEIAPRPHNSGHWTIDACVTSQFEQFVRAICGLPLGNPSRHSNAVMRNLIGDDIERVGELVKDPDTKIHLYGKAEARPGRKMGHVTKLYPLDGGGAKPPVPGV